ncbi:hypothetical protein P3X46_028746 [Hevea brasiliensis]|uniref:Pentatricopeptide repeat-containing protein n=1 Tax=Hevea brasiliensis TaxID=3981 RepID=A0ABQ9KR97_HEVBR|nr:hypothetical protein P3X46_028746 [Hevea brasiliensis]
MLPKSTRCKHALDRAMRLELTVRVHGLRDTEYFKLLPDSAARNAASFPFLHSYNHMCILSCFVKVGDLIEAERVFMEWETNCRKHDIRVSNVILGAYAPNGLINKAESLHLHTLERRGCPNYKTWEILMNGWTIKWYFNDYCRVLEKNRNFEDANHYFLVIHHFGLASLPLYNILLRKHVRKHVQAQSSF